MVSNRRNLIGQTVIEGTVASLATVAVFKDVELQIEFLSKTNSVISRQNITLYEMIRPGKSVDFKKKISAGKDTKNIRFSIVGAKPAD